MLRYQKIDVSEGIDVTKQVHEKNMNFVTISLVMLDLNLKRMFLTNVMIY